jgi:tetratricopeptide (TPR) repeat protein
MDWAFGPDGNGELGLALTGRSWAVWAALSKWAPYQAWSDLALTRITADTPERTSLVVWATAATVNAITLASPAVAEQYLPALRAEEDWTLLGDVLMNMTFALILQGRHDDAVARHAELKSIVAPLPTNRLTIGCQRLAGTLAADAGDFAGAVKAFETGVEMANAIGAFGWANLILGERLYFEDGSPDATIALARELLARIRPDHMFSSVSNMLGTYQLMRQLARRNGPGDLDEAFALGRAREKAEGRAVPIQALIIVPFPAVADGRPRDGARLFGYAMAAMNAYGVRYAEQRKQADAIRQKLSESLSEAELETLMAEGARLNAEQHFVLSMKLEG